LSAAKPNRQWHVSLGFVALLLNPTYDLSPDNTQWVHSQKLCPSSTP
jgi:hypothetical protein